jgi:hypothetical protein
MNKKNQNILYLTDITKFKKVELNKDTIKITNIVVKNTNKNLFRGKSIHICFILSNSIFSQRYQTTKKVNININISFHIQITLRNVPSNHNAKVTNVCKKNCNKSNHKNHFMINSKLSFIRLYILHNLK